MASTTMRTSSSSRESTPATWAWSSVKKSYAVAPAQRLVQHLLPAGKEAVEGGAGDAGLGGDVVDGHLGHAPALAAPLGRVQHPVLTGDGLLVGSDPARGHSKRGRLGHDRHSETIRRVSRLIAGNGLTGPDAAVHDKLRDDIAVVLQRQPNGTSGRVAACRSCRSAGVRQGPGADRTPGGNLDASILGRRHLSRCSCTHRCRGLRSAIGRWRWHAQASGRRPPTRGAPAGPSAGSASAGPGGPQDAGSTGGGGLTTFRILCDSSHIAPDDPIVHPNMAGMSHLHQFLGNRTTNAASTTQSLLGQATTCSAGGRQLRLLGARCCTRTVSPLPASSALIYYRGGSHRDPAGHPGLPGRPADDRRRARPPPSPCRPTPWPGCARA